MVDKSFKRWNDQINRNNDEFQSFVTQQKTEELKLHTSIDEVLKIEETA